MQKRPDCAESIQQNARVCRFCGYRYEQPTSPTPAVSPVPPSASPPPPPAVTRKTKPLKVAAFVVAGLLLCVIALGAAGAIAVGPRPGAKQDADAKSDARNAVSQVESCYVDNESYDACDTTFTGLDFGSDNGQVELRDATDTTYTVIAHSRSGHDFTIAPHGRRRVLPQLRPAGKGLCGPSGSW